mgnify:CR=1 FL=1|jgi:hypothetical protein
MHAKGFAAFLSFLMLFLLLLTGCDGTQRSDPEQTIGSEQEPSSLRSAPSETLPFSLKNPSAPKRISNQQAQLLFDSSSAKGEAKKIRYLSNFCGDLFCMSYAGLDGEQDSNITSFAIYDGKTQKATQVGQIANTTASSGDAVFMDERYFYTWYGSADAGGADINNLIRIDTKDKKFSVVAKRKNVAALINLSKLSATEFIGYVPSQAEDSVVTEIEKYDGQTGERKTILKNEFFYQEGKQNSRGTVLEVACAADGKIYGLGRQKKNGEDHCYLYTYDGNGKLLSQTEEPEIGREIANPLHMDLIGNLLVLKDHRNLRAALFLRQGAHYVRVFGAEQYDFAGGLETLYDSAKTPYLYFKKNSLDWPEEAGKSVFYAVHTQTGEITRLQAEIDPQYPFLDQIHMDEDGNLLLVYLQQMYGQDFKAYQVSGEALGRILADP